MALLSHATIIDNVQSLLGSNTTDFSDAFLTLRIVEALPEFSRYCPLIVKETLCATEDSKELDISFISNMLWIGALEYRVGRTNREWRNWKEHYRDTLSMKIDWWPADTDSGIDTDEVLDTSETGITCDADASDAIEAGDIIRIDNELMYVTVVSTVTLTVVRGYNQTEAVAHATNADIYIPELAYLYVAKQHLIPPLTDLAGEVDLGAGYLADARTIHIDGMGTSDTLYKDYLFTLENDGSGTVYRLTEDTTLATSEGDITFMPGLAEDVADGDDITFKNSTFENSRQESLFIDLLAARSAMSISTKFINKVNVGGGVWRDWVTWGREHLIITLNALEKESLRYRQPYKIHSRDYSSLSEVT